MAIDAWNPDTFSDELLGVLEENSDLVVSYHIEGKRLMDEHLNSSPYRSLEPNPFTSAYLSFSEEVLAPVLAKARIRTWHYTRLTDAELDQMCQGLVASSLGFLSDRLDKLVTNQVISRDIAEEVLGQSPLHKQKSAREGRLWSVVIPVPSNDGGVAPLLRSWGGESAYFWLSSEVIANKLKDIGKPRIIELETSLSDGINAHSVADTILEAWAVKYGAKVTLTGCDLAVTASIPATKVLHAHSEGDASFELVGIDYPARASELINHKEED